MIRVYLDWGVISNLKKEENLELKNFLTAHKNSIFCPYTPTHFNDLLKSLNDFNQLIHADLNTIESICGANFLDHQNGKFIQFEQNVHSYFEERKSMEPSSMKENINQAIEILNEDPELKKILENTKIDLGLSKENMDIFSKISPNSNVDGISLFDCLRDVSEFSDSLTFDRDFYKNFRDIIKESGFKLPQNFGNWKPQDVVKNMDNFLAQFKNDMTYQEYVEYVCSKNPNAQNSRYEFYTNAYLLFDLLGFKPDKLKKETDNMQNILNDANHSFFSAYCDYFIVQDKILKLKTEALFSYLKIQTAVVSPDEFLIKIKTQINNLYQNDYTRTGYFSFLKKEKIVKREIGKSTEDADTYVFTLPIFLFNYFNYAVMYVYKMEKFNAVILEFKRRSTNYSSFIFDIELKRLISEIVKAYNLFDNLNFELKLRSFVNKDYENAIISHKGEDHHMQLSIDKHTNYPMLTITMSLAK